MIKAKINNKIINQFNKNGYVTLDKFIDLKYINKIIKRTELLFFIHLFMFFCSSGCPQPIHALILKENIQSLQALH